MMNSGMANLQLSPRVIDLTFRQVKPISMTAWLNLPNLNVRDNYGRAIEFYR
jgi:hypothetical protein